MGETTIRAKCWFGRCGLIPRDSYDWYITEQLSNASKVDFTSVNGGEEIYKFGAIILVVTEGDYVRE